MLTRIECGDVRHLCVVRCIALTQEEEFTLYLDLSR